MINLLQEEIDASKLLNEALPASNEFSHSTEQMPSHSENNLIVEVANPTGDVNSESMDLSEAITNATTESCISEIAVECRFRLVCTHKSEATQENHLSSKPLILTSILHHEAINPLPELVNFKRVATNLPRPAEKTPPPPEPPDRGRRIEKDEWMAYPCCLYALGWLRYLHGLKRNNDFLLYIAVLRKFLTDTRRDGATAPPLVPKVVPLQPEVVSDAGLHTFLSALKVCGLGAIAATSKLLLDFSKKKKLERQHDLKFKLNKQHIRTSKFICNRGYVAYYYYCVQPPHLNVSIGPYFCTKHTRCHRCGFNVPGNALSVGSFMVYTGCDDCGRLFVNGNYYPFCLKSRINLELKLIVCGDNCQLLLHCHGGNISEKRHPLCCGILCSLTIQILSHIGLLLWTPMVQSVSMILTREDLPTLNFLKYQNPLVALLSLVILTMFASLKTGVTALHFADQFSITFLLTSQHVLGVQQNFYMLVKKLIILHLSCTMERFLKSTLHSCQDACLRNCLCLVLYYENNISKCFPFYMTRSFQRFKGSTSGYVSYWKVSTDGGGNGNKSGRKNMLLVVVIVTLTVLVIADLIPGYLYYNIQHYPTFNLEDKVDLYGDGNVMVPVEVKSKRMLNKANDANKASQVSKWKQLVVTEW